MQQELDPFGVLEGVLALLGVDALEGGDRVPEPQRLGDQVGSRSVAPSRAWPATLWVTSPDWLLTRFCVNSSAVSG